MMNGEGQDSKTFCGFNQILLKLIMIPPGIKGCPSENASKFDFSLKNEQTNIQILTQPCFFIDWAGFVYEMI